MGILIRVTDATFGYDDQPNVFEHVDFEVGHGQIMSVLGPNGCGKSTLLKCLNGIHQLRAGQVCVDGHDLRLMKPNLIGRTIGYVPQTQSSTFPYTVQEMVTMGRAPFWGFFGSPSEQDRVIVRETMLDLGLGELADRPYSNLSGGQAQMVLIARALATEPRVLLLDEPTSHLDIGHQMAILNTLEGLAKSKDIAIIMATHFPEHALAISDQAVLFGDNGKKPQAGDARKIITEDNLREAFGIAVKIVHVNTNDHWLCGVIPWRKRHDLVADSLGSAMGRWR